MTSPVLGHIPAGRENAISRAELCRITGWPDRTVRREIKRLVSQGVPILSSSQARGYWYSESLQEIEEFIREEDARQRTSRKTTARLRRMVKEAHRQIDGQLRMEEVK